MAFEVYYGRMASASTDEPQMRVGVMDVSFNTAAAKIIRQKLGLPDYEIVRAAQLKALAEKSEPPEGLKKIYISAYYDRESGQIGFHPAERSTTGRLLLQQPAGTATLNITASGFIKKFSIKPGSIYKIEWSDEAPMIICLPFIIPQDKEEDEDEEDETIKNGSTNGRQGTVEESVDFTDRDLKSLTDDDLEKV